jgi:hypothetical protein
VIFGAFLINFAALIFLGIVSRRMGAFPAAWTSLPLAMGVLTFPLIAVGGDDETEILDGWLEAPCGLHRVERLGRDRITELGRQLALDRKGGKDRG